MRTSQLTTKTQVDITVSVGTHPPAIVFTTAQRNLKQNEAQIDRAESIHKGVN